jgi:hypothetical protein
MELTIIMLKQNKPSSEKRIPHVFLSYEESGSGGRKEHEHKGRGTVWMVGTSKRLEGGERSWSTLYAHMKNT